MRTPLKAAAFIGTPSQDKAMFRLKRFLRERNEHSKDCYSEPIVTHTSDVGYFISVTIEIQRSDCEDCSARAIVCDEYLNAHIGKRGKISVKTFRSGTTDRTEHAIQMLKY